MRRTGHNYLSGYSGYPYGPASLGPYAGYGYSQIIMCYDAPTRDGRIIQERNRFPKEVVDKAWGMVEAFLTRDQWHAFYEERQSVELVNKEGTHRLLINRSGEFKLLKGGIGEGIIEVQGSVYEGRYPLGDEVAALVALFRYDTPKMVENWRCSNFSSSNESWEVIGEAEEEPFLTASLTDVRDSIEEGNIEKTGLAGLITHMKELWKEVRR